MTNTISSYEVNMSIKIDKAENQIIARTQLIFISKSMCVNGTCLIDDKWVRVIDCMVMEVDIQ